MTAQLKESTHMRGEEFKSIFETALDGIIVTGIHMNIVDVNTSASEICKYSKSELLKKKVTDLVSREQKRNIKRTWRRLQQKGLARGEFEIERKDGEKRMIEYSARAQFLPQRNLLVFRDITDRKEEEKRREHLLGIASHELRTPLASIRAFTEILKRLLSSYEDPKIHQYLGKIDDKTETLAQLINDLLDIARIRGDNLEFHFELFDFDRFLDEVISDIGYTALTHKIIKKGKIQKDIIADKNRIAQVLINIIKNAVKYSPDADSVIVRASLSGEIVKISIQDFGVGIPKKDNKKIFDLFYRVSHRNEKRIYGLGVGLFISKEIIKKRGGKIWVRSKRGKGSTFYIELPIQPK